MPEIGNDGWDWDDEDGEREIPRVTLCGSYCDLEPTPPADWLKVISYDSRSPVSFIETAAWIYCVADVQNWEYYQGLRARRHAICRSPAGQRVLVVHPDLRDGVNDAVDSINAIFTGAGSNCGGWQILEPTLQSRAARVFTRRAISDISPSLLRRMLEDTNLEIPDVLQFWNSESTAKRLDAINRFNLPPELLFADEVVHHWIEAFRDDEWESQLLHEVYETVTLHAGWIENSFRPR